MCDHQMISASEEPQLPDGFRPPEIPQPAARRLRLTGRSSVLLLSVWCAASLSRVIHALGRCGEVRSPTPPRRLRHIRPTGNAARNYARQSPGGYIHRLDHGKDDCRAKQKGNEYLALSVRRDWIGLQIEWKRHLRRRRTGNWREPAERSGRRR